MNAAAAPEQYHVESIQSDRKIKGCTRYEIKWKDFEVTTFEQLQNLNHCNDTLQAYLREKSLTKRLTRDNLLAFDRHWVEPRVVQVVDSRIVNDQSEYQVRWVGDDELSWEPLENLDNCLDLVYNYLTPLMNETIQDQEQELFDDAFDFVHFNAMEFLGENNVIEAITHIHENEQLEANQEIFNDNQIDELFEFNDEQVQNIFEAIANRDEDVELDTEIDMDLEQVAELLVNLTNMQFF